MDLPNSNEELVKKIQQGIDREENLIQLFLNVKKLIRKLLNRACIDADYYKDAMQEAFLCMQQAVEKFDVNMGYKFSTFLTEYIEKGVIMDYRYKHSLSVKVPSAIRSLYFQSRNAEKELFIVLQRKPSIDELSEHLGVSSKLLTQAINANKDAISLQQSASTDDETLLIEDMLEDEKSCEEFTKIESYDLKNTLDDALKHLPSECEKCLRLSFYKEYTQKEIADILHIKPSQVSSNIDKGIKELRKNKTIQALKNNY